MLVCTFMSISWIEVGLALVFADGMSAKADGRSKIHRRGTCTVGGDGAAIHDVGAKSEQVIDVVSELAQLGVDCLHLRDHDSLLSSDPCCCLDRSRCID